MFDQGTVEVGGITFLWSVMNRVHPIVTVSRAGYGSMSETAAFRPKTLARLLAKELLARKTAESVSSRI